MSAAVAITLRDLTATELRLAAAKEKQASAARRMLALALVVEGADRLMVAKMCGMERQAPRG